MGRKEILGKVWRRGLTVPIVFLVFLVAGCQPDSRAESLPEGDDLLEETVTEAVQFYHSDTQPEECFLCGEGKGTHMSLYRGQENIGIINLNTLDLAPVTINQYDDFGELIEKPVKDSSTYITNTGENGFLLSVTPDINRGYAHGYLSFSRDEVLDIERAASHLCSDCLNRMMDQCWTDIPLSMGVVNFRTGEIRLFEEKILAFTFGDYYISCEEQGDDDDEEKEISLLVFYCPERYSE